MAKGDTYGLVIYEQDFDVKSDRLARTHGTKLLSDDLAMLLRFDGGPAQDWEWLNTRPEQGSRTYVVDTDAPGLSEDAELVKIEGDNAKVTAENGEWYTKTRAARLRSIISLSVLGVLSLVCVYMSYLEYDRVSDLSGFVIRQQREIEAAEEAARDRAGQQAQEVIIQGEVSEEPGLQSLPTPVSTPAPRPTPDLPEDAS